MTRYLTKDTPLPPYMIFPRFLMARTDLNETAKILYVLLLDRARLSVKNDTWQDELGHAFIVYPIQDLATTIHKSEMTVKTALAALEKHDLIQRKQQGLGKPNRIYVKLPNEATTQTTFCPSDRKNPVCQRERNLSGNKNYKNKNYTTNKRSYECKEDESL